MASNVTENVETVLTGDSSGVEGAFARATAAAKGNAKNEKVVSDEILKIRKNREREFVLAPIREAQAAQRAADARARTEQKAADKEVAIAKKKAADKLKAEMDAVDKIKRQREASTGSNIVGEVRGNFANNAKERLGGYLQKGLGLSEDAAQGLVGKVGRLAPIIGVAAVGATALYKAFSLSRNRAAEQAEKMHDVSQELLKSSRINMFASSTEGANTLFARAEEARQQILEARAAFKENDPYGAGGGFFGNLKNIILQASQAKAQFLQDAGVDMGMESSFDKQEREKKNLELTSRLREGNARKDRKLASENLTNEVDLARKRLDADAQTVAIADLQIQKQAALNALKRDSAGAASKEDLAKVSARYDMQIRAQEELRDAMTARYNLEVAINQIALSALSPEAQKVQSARMRNQEIKEEIANRSHLTTQEKRAFDLERQANDNAIRSAQREQVMKSPRQQNREALQQRRQELRNSQADARLAQNDGLRNGERDINGNLTGGIDILTNKYRPVSEDFNRKMGGAFSGGQSVNFGPRTGLTGGGLTSTPLDRNNTFESDAARKLRTANHADYVLATMPSASQILARTPGVKDMFEKPKVDRPQYYDKQDPNHGQNDQSPGRTLQSGQRAMVEAQNISNDYLKNISECVTSGQWS